jgi:hypothetical protein
MDDPLDFLHTAEVGTLLLVTAAAAYTWSRLFPRLLTKESPHGIVSLQLAFTARKAHAVIDCWRVRHLDGAAKRAQYIDLLFIVFYASALGLLAIAAGRAADSSGLLNPSDAGTAAAWLAIGAWVAGLCDFVENGGLLLQLSSNAKGRLSGVLVAATSTVSTLKWSLALGAGLASLGILARSALAAL